MLVGEIADRPEVGEYAVHREHAVGRDQLEARAGGVGFHELRREVGHVVVAVAIAPGFAQAYAVDDARVIELVADHSILLAQERLEEAAVRVEAAPVENAVVGAQKRGERRFERLVLALRAADEADRRHAESVAIEAILRGGNDPHVVGESQIIVRAEVEHALAGGELDHRRLRAADRTLALVEPVRANLIDRSAEVGQISGIHRVWASGVRTPFAPIIALLPRSGSFERTRLLPGRASGSRALPASGAFQRGVDAPSVAAWALSA